MESCLCENISFGENDYLLGVIQGTSKAFIPGEATPTRFTTNMLLEYNIIDEDIKMN